MLCRLGRMKEQRICFVWFILCARTHVSVRRRDACSEGCGVWPVHAHIFIGLSMLAQASPMTNYCTYFCTDLANILTKIKLN